MAEVDRYVAAKEVAIGTDSDVTVDGVEYEAGSVVTFAEGQEVPFAGEIPSLAGLLLNGYLRAEDADGNDVSREQHDAILAAERGDDETGGDVE